MDKWTWLVLLLQMTTMEGHKVTKQQQQPPPQAQLLIPGKGHVQWLPHRLRPPLQEVILKRLKRNDNVDNNSNNYDDDMNHANVTGHRHLMANSTLTDHQHRKNLISDKEIVVIVVCSSIGLVICLLGTAISAKKVHGDASGQYQGVLQKDTSDEHIVPSHKDKDGRHQMFAQIDEMEEEGGSCPTTPPNSNKILQNGGDVKVIEPTPTAIQLNGKVETMKPPEVMTTTVEVEMQKPSSDTEEAAEEEANDEEVERLYCRTGLSQSDCSLSSFTSVNPSYKYGNQSEHLGGYYGMNDELLLPLLPPYSIPIPKEEEVETEREVQAEVVDAVQESN